jgi:hypothetical protein
MICALALDVNIEGVFCCTRLGGQSNQSTRHERGTNDHGELCDYWQGRADRRVELPIYPYIPGMQDRVLCEMPLDVSPKPDILEQWELEESWLVVSANTMRALGFTRSNARPGEKAVGALVIFQATEVREATADERRALMEARKVSKLQAKQRRAARKAERDAAKAQVAERQSA